jgi:hypothetical protein
MPFSATIALKLHAVPHLINIARATLFTSHTHATSCNFNFQWRLKIIELEHKFQTPNFALACGQQKINRIIAYFLSNRSSHLERFYHSTYTYTVCTMLKIINTIPVPMICFQYPNHYRQSHWSHPFWTWHLFWARPPPQVSYHR